ncbi:hypothetical protein EXU57_11155 [Segetibacter sp. 3557_3]|uniref:hypothetical protein n=1 Tax=Segetibacter sp. 3557_3 TaxID=2547429 RepID=UPI0010584268|nr:hypothetical protein [Segetibacter sp. 3557_3]TDH26051.1 hypothetical protein EXU57_11155 [Segetibacter sp. 3557_3]
MMKHLFQVAATILLFSPAAQSQTEINLEKPVWQLVSTADHGRKLTTEDVGVLYTKSGNNYYRRVFYGRAEASWWGVIVNDGKDDYPALQKAVNECIKQGVSLNLPKGEIELSEGIVIRNGPEGKPSEYVTMDLYGDGNAFDPNIGGGTKLKLLDKTGAAIYLQKGKGCTISDIKIEGQNTGLFNFSIWDMVNTKSFTTNGVADNANAPHAGIVIDPFYTATTRFRYPKKLKYYTEISNSGSTSIKINNVYISSFVANFCISPAGLQNGENIFLTNCWSDHSNVAVSTGSSQNRQVRIENFTCWGQTQTVFDSYSYTSGGSACPPIVNGFNIAQVKYLCRVGAWFGNASNFMNGFAEEIYSLGGCFEQRSNTFYITNCLIYLMGSQLEKDKLIRNPRQVLQCDDAVFDKTLIALYGKPIYQIGLSVNDVLVDKGEIPAPFIVTAGRVRYNFVTVRSKGYKIDQGGVQSENIASEAKAIQAVNERENSWSFISESANKIKAGDFVTLTNERSRGAFEYSNPQFYSGGTVVKVNTATGEVVVQGLASEMAKGEKYSIYTTRLPQRNDKAY